MASIKNLVHQTSSSTGTGDLTLAAVNGKQTFAAAFGTGSPPDVFYYFAFNRNAAEWEYGTGHMSDATTLVRDTIIASTNSNAAVNFTTGTIDVTNDLPAEKQFDTSNLDTDGTLAANSDTRVSSQKAVKTFVAASISALSSVYQAISTALTQIAGLSPSNDDFLQRKAGAWANRTVAQVKSDLSLSGTNTGDQTSVTGNAGTATALQTARNIDGQAFDGTGNITVIAPGTHAASSKSTPVDADELPLVDSAASNVLKKLTWANLKATLKTYFDTLYVSLTATAQSISGGARFVTFDNGTKSSGTFTPDPGNGPHQKYNQNGAITVAPGTNYGTYWMDRTNGASAGATTTSGWTAGVDGDPFDTTSGSKFMMMCRVSELGSYMVVKKVA